MSVADLLTLRRRCRQRYHLLALGGLLLPLLALLLLDRLFPLTDVLVRSEWVQNGAAQAALSPADRRNFAQTVVDRHDRPLRIFADQAGQWRYPVSLDQVSDYYLQAVLNYEDRWFYYHPGFNPFAIVRAAWQNWRCGCIVSGGSTITMQVARRMDPHQRSLSGKLHQLLRAIQLEWHLSKQEILTLYLNYVPMGGVIEGVEAASRLYLDRSAAQLSLAQGALLAVLPQAPSRLRPDRYPGRAKAARDKVLQRLLDFEVISPEQFQRATLESVVAWQPDLPLLSPLLTRSLHQRYPQQGVIRTTLDADIQRELQTLLQEEIRLFPDGHSAAILVADNASGQVLAYVGSADFLNRKRFGHVDMVQALRSPGSTLKPFIYGLALDEGLIHSASLLRDTPRYQKAYQPENFARAFTGAVDTHTALRQSLNLPVVQVLEALTPARFAAALANVRTPYRLPQGAQPNLAMALGGGGFNLWDLVTLYSALANEGQVRPLTALKPAADSERRAVSGQARAPADSGNRTDRARWLMSPEAAWVTARLLRNPRPDQLHNPSIREQAPGIAWKTGTSYGFRDAWAVGVTPRLTLGVWVGRPDGTPSPGYFGAVTALPLLFRIQSFLDPSPRWPQAPAAVKDQVICWPLGRLASQTRPEHCHVAHKAWIIRQQVPPTLRDSGDGLQPNPLTVRVNARGERISSGCLPESGPVQTRQLALWPQGTEPWLPVRWRFSAQLPPLAPGCQDDARLSPPLQLIGLDDGERLLQPDTRNGALEVEVFSLGGQGTRSWFLNGHYQGQSRPGAPLRLRFAEPGPYELVLLDARGHTLRIQVQLEAARRR